MSNYFEQYEQKKDSKSENKFEKYGVIEEKGSGARTFNQYLSGINETIDKTIRFIPDGIIRPAAVLLGADIPLEGKPTIIGEIANAQKPQNKAERVARGAGNTTGEAAMGLVGGAAVAPAKLTMAAKNQLMANPSVKSIIRNLTDDIVNGFAQAPGKSTAAEMGTAALAGVGGAAAFESTGSQGARLAGEVGGAMAPTVLASTPTALMMRGTAALSKRLSKDAQITAARNEVRTVLGQELDDSAKLRISEAEELEGQIDGLQFSLAEKAENQSLINMQKQLEGSATGAELEWMNMRRKNNVLAIQKFGENSAPSGEPVPDYIVDTVGKSFDTVDTEIELARQKLGKSQEGVAAKAPQADRAAQGAKIRDRFFDLKSAKADEMSIEAKKLGVLDIEITDSFDQLRVDILDELKPDSFLSDKGNVPDALKRLNETKPKIDPDTKKRAKPRKTTFKDVKAFRERLGDEIRDEMASSSPKVKKIRDLVITKQRVDGYIENLADEGAIPADMAEKYNAFRNLYKTEYIEKFENGAAFKMKVRGQGDFYKTLDEKVADVFFSPGQVTRAREFKAAFDGDQVAMDALESSILDKMRTDVVKDGVINEAAYKNWIRKHNSVLNEFPNMKKKISDMGTANAEILGRQQQLNSRQKFMQSRSLYRKIANFRKEGKTPESVLKESMKDERLLDQVINLVKDDEVARKGFRRWVWDQATDGNPNQIKQYIFNNEDMLGKVLDKEHLDNIKTILRAEEKITLVPSTDGAAFEPMPFRRVEELTGASVPTMINRGYAVQSGRVQKAWLYSEALMKAINRNRLNELNSLMKTALYEPELAKILASEAPTNLKVKNPTQKLNTWLFQAGIAPLEDE